VRYQSITKPAPALARRWPSGLNATLLAAWVIGQHGLHGKGNAQGVSGAQKGKQRPNMFDDSLRVPLLVHWPRVVKAGTEVRALVSNIDTFASVLGMLDVPPPRDYRQEGLDFAPLLRGQKVAWRDAERWHLVRQYLANQPDELFDLQNDPGELRNLYGSAEFRTVRDDLQRRLDGWMRSIGDPVAAPPGAGGGTGPAEMNDVPNEPREGIVSTP
jgi:uncharacterized sulfatase